MCLLTFFHDVLTRTPRAAFLQPLFLFISFAGGVGRKNVWGKKKLNRQSKETVFGNCCMPQLLRTIYFYYTIYYYYSSDNAFATLCLLIISDGQKSLQAVKL